jgi:hypothetical protein
LPPPRSRRGAAACRARRGRAGRPPRPCQPSPDQPNASANQPDAWYAIVTDARAGNRRSWLCSAPRAHAKAPHKTDLLWERHRAPDRPERGPHGGLLSGPPPHEVWMTVASESSRPLGTSTCVVFGSRSASACPGRKPPVLRVKRPARPYKTAIQNKFTTENGDGAHTPSPGPDHALLLEGLQLLRGPCLGWDGSLHSTCVPLRRGLSR